ncbi:hypothetical protein ACFXG4_34110 [Nocardia sp. NPDC059246]|uniref:hypothetical protein n=1 Tax=unclassified Nocardia TaxID=2637762 RepID=UPI003692DF01
MAQLGEIANTGRSREDLGALLNTMIAQLGVDAGPAEYRRQIERYFATRRNNEGNVVGLAVDGIEARLEMLKTSYASYDQVPQNLTQIDTYFVAKGYDSAQATLIAPLDEMKTVLSRIRQSVHDYLVVAEDELMTGQTESRFFDQVQAHTNQLLTKYAPEASKNFVAAQDRFAAGDNEAISHAMTSCRRMIKSLADSLYPATGKDVTGLDGVNRTMSDDAYRNRLLQYVREKVGKHRNGAVLQAVITELGTRLNALDALSSKGVHANPSIDEARTCIAQTYLLAADLLSIAEGTSYHLKSPAPASCQPEPADAPLTA